MKFRPLHDRVVVKRLDEEQKTNGGIIIPDTAAEKPQTGKIVSVGPGVRGEDGRAALEIVNAIYESARVGKAIKLAPR